MKPPIVNLDTLEPQPLPPAFAPTGPAAERFAPRIARIGGMLGAKKLGYSLIVLEPGKRAFPFHHHRVNEEMSFVVEGEGEVRIGSETHAIRAGDIIACPPGDSETAHQIINTSEATLRYLAISTMQTPEVVEYPDTGRQAVLVADEPGIKGLRAVFRASDSLDYWEGE
ncbi:cupin [Burkholderia sp. SFA1]|uniref:cupin domain-containing protein n=1 Tax=unclassified Caballeronia TaxID=2646786 RepID=UPI001F25C33C|nr:MULTISPECIES: cupin domain-containing protein [unclassified Caballeronia]MCE4544992.1 cupin domain-containing protein [Caballeronia sp. PC1]MCE4570416.1 cupin domain-containing protein [Caballeronia sp. CLC5]BBP98253.1 cupin [Burkholderia sp. SFA1]